MQFVIASCSPGVTVNLTMDFGATIPAGVSIVKAGNLYRLLPATINGSIAQFSITDGGEFDADGVANGRIVDPSGASILADGGIVPDPGPREPLPIPVNNPLLLLFLSLGLSTLVGIAYWRHRAANTQ